MIYVVNGIRMAKRSLDHIHYDICGERDTDGIEESGSHIHYDICGERDTDG